jgi:hypothetical protein
LVYFVGFADAHPPTPRKTRGASARCAAAHVRLRYNSGMEGQIGSSPVTCHLSLTAC